MILNSPYAQLIPEPEDGRFTKTVATLSSAFTIQVPNMFISEAGVRNVLEMFGTLCPIKVVRDNPQVCVALFTFLMHHTHAYIQTFRVEYLNTGEAEHAFVHITKNGLLGARVSVQWQFPDYADGFPVEIDITTPSSSEASLAAELRPCKSSSLMVCTSVVLTDISTRPAP